MILLRLLLVNMILFVQGYIMLFCITNRMTNYQRPIDIEVVLNLCLFDKKVVFWQAV